MDEKKTESPNLEKIQSDKIKDLENLILKKEIEFREVARKEGEKGRNEALKILTSVVVVFGILCGIGIVKWISYSIQKATKEATAEKVLEKTVLNADSIENIKSQASNLLITMSAQSKQIFESDWKEVLLQNSWTNVGDKYSLAGFLKDGFGRVYLRGLIKGGKKNRPVFILPEAFRPRFREIFIAKSGEGYTRVDVDKNGEVLVAENFNFWISLNNINFSSGSSAGDSVVSISTK